MVLIRYLLIIVIILSTACSENVSFQEKDISKYPWLSPFIEKNVDIEGSQNLDLGTIEFSYQTSKNPAELFSHFDSVAQSEKWITKQSASYVRTYSKKVKIYSSGLTEKQVNISLNPEKKEVSCIVN